MPDCLTGLSPSPERAAGRERRVLETVLVALALLFGLSGCGKEQDKSADGVIRGLRAYKVAGTTDSRVQRFPTVLQPADISQLSFEISGQLTTVNLNTGQKVRIGDVLAELDPRSLHAQLDQARAAVKEAEAIVANAEADFRRKSELLKRGFAPQAAFDQSQATLLTARAQRDQAQRQVDVATHNLERSRLIAPFSGNIAGVDVKSFGQVAAGQTVVTLYSDDSLEMSFSAPPRVFQALQVGQPVQVAIADYPALSLTGVITELGSKAEQVSAFPAVVRLKNDVPGLNAGMAAEVSVELPLTDGTGYLVPLTVLVPEGEKDVRGVASVFVYDAASSTVHKREVTVSGVRGNQLAVTGGLQPGDLVALPAYRI
jgi:RND family efflux transporter MFP subunit